MEITAAMVKELREMTGAGMMDCKAALTETGGDMEAAVDALRKKGLADLAKKAGRATNEGLVGSYIHAGGRIGVLVQVSCETDFVARNEEFKNFVHDVAMHIAAASPRWVSRDDVPQEVIDHEMEIYKAQAADSGKPEEIQEKIAQGRLEKFYKEVCLLEQPFVKDPDITVEQLLGELVSKLGENMAIAQFARFEISGSASC
ncbi:MAG: translation elongation factor Ts [Coriobacteriia bacterium]